MYATVQSVKGCYVVFVNLEDGSIGGLKPFANFGWMEGDAIATRDLINQDRIAYERVCAKVRMYDPHELFGAPRYNGRRIDFPYRKPWLDGEKAALAKMLAAK